jgi:membrane-bound lytic murein transglycosylase A
MVAQDTGGAIKGNVRADFFWGFGPDAAENAGKMKQTGRMWVLMPVEYLPKDFPPAARVLGSSK